MTLILSAFDKNYIMMTSDSAYNEAKYNSRGEKTTEYKYAIHANKGFKVTRLANGILYGAAGTYELHELILNTIRPLIKKNDHLTTVAKLFRKVLADLEEKNSLFRYCIYGKELGFAAYLMGFDKAGHSKRVDINSLNQQLNISVVNNSSWGALPPPGLTGEVNGSIFNFGDATAKDPLKENKIRLRNIHSLFAYALPEAVSQDCTIYIIKKVGKQYIFSKKTYDTSEDFKKWPSKEEVEKFLILKEEVK